MQVDTGQSVRSRRSRAPKVRAPYDLKSHARSRMGNGAEILPNLDGRSLWARRLRELLAMHISDLGGESNVSAAELALLRRAINLIVECERRECGFAQAGEATDQALLVYQTCINCLRRTLEALGLKRRPRDLDDDGSLLFEEALKRNGSSTP